MEKGVETMSGIKGKGATHAMSHYTERADD
jgi:hypothetical protein